MLITNWFWRVQQHVRANDDRRSSQRADIESRIGFAATLRYREQPINVSGGFQQPHIDLILISIIHLQHYPDSKSNQSSTRIIFAEFGFDPTKWRRFVVSC